MLKFSEILNDLIAINEKNKREFAKKVNLSNSQVSDFCSGKREPSVNNVIKIANYFNCTADFLLGLSEENNNKNLNLNTPFDIDLFIKRLEISKREKSYFEVSKLAEIPNSIIYDWEAKKHNPSIKSMIKLAQVLPESVDFLIGRRDINKYK